MKNQNEPCHKCGVIDGHTRQCTIPSMKGYNKEAFDKHRTTLEQKYSIDVSKFGGKKDES